MTTSDGFLSRWSRRKAQAKVAVPAVPLAEPDVPALALPDLETLGSGSDYTAFLQKGVAAEVQRQALQRAWESDAGIAAFRGMADYDWDFNAPTYGRLRLTDNVAELLRAVLASPPEPETETPEGVEVGTPEVAAPGPLAVTQALPLAVAAAEPSEAEAPRRRHGSALPC